MEQKQDIKIVTVGNNPSRIAVNSNKNKVYVANRGDNTVSVIDGKNDMIVAILQCRKNPTGININLNQNILYVANNLDHEITVIDKAST